MSLAQAINETIDRPAGGTWTKLRETGQTIVGELVDIEERNKMFDGAPVLSKKGNQRVEWVITLRVDQPDPAIEDDDQIRRIAAGETLQWAITDHMRDTGQHFPSTWGGRLAIVVTRGAETATSSVDKAGFQIKYVAPTGAPAAAINTQIAAAPAASVPSVDDLV